MSRVFKEFDTMLANMERTRRERNKADEETLIRRLKDECNQALARQWKLAHEQMALVKKERESIVEASFIIHSGCQTSWRTAESITWTEVSRRQRTLCTRTECTERGTLPCSTRSPHSLRSLSDRWSTKNEKQKPWRNCKANWRTNISRRSIWSLFDIKKKRLTWTASKTAADVPSAIVIRFFLLRLKHTEERFRREFSSRARLESDFRVCAVYAASSNRPLLSIFLVASNWLQTLHGQ